MKKIVILLLLAGLVTGSFACTKISIDDNAVTDNKKDGTDDPLEAVIYTDQEISERNYHNFAGSGSFFAQVAERMFYVECPPYSEKNICRLVEITDNGHEVIIDKKALIDIYPEGNTLHILSREGGKNKKIKAYDYSYDLTSDTLTKTASPVKYGKDLRISGNDRYYLEYDKKGNGKLYDNDKEFALSKESLVNCYINDDYIYCIESGISEYAIIRYDRKTAKSESILTVESKIVKDIYGWDMRTASFDKLLIEGDYLIYLKSVGNTVLNDEGKEDYRSTYALAYRLLSNLSEEVMITNMNSEDEHSYLLDFAVFKGKVYYSRSNELVEYDLKTNTSKQLLSFGGEFEPFRRIFGIYLGFDDKLYLNTSTGLHRIDKNGENPQVVYYYDTKYFTE